MSGQYLEGETRTPAAHVDAGHVGCSKSLKSRHVNMIAIGGALVGGWFGILRRVALPSTDHRPTTGAGE